MLSVLLWLGLGVAAPDEATVFTDVGVLPSEAAAAARASAHFALPDRMKAVSEPFLDVPYLVDGHGEGVEPDIDPPARYDVFDCVTFVEEVLALAFAGDPVSAPMYRNALRYADGVPEYGRRHHFMMAEWIPANIEAGFLVDITSSLGETHRIVKTVERKTWSNWQGTRQFKHSLGELPVGTYGLNVLSLDAAAAAADQFPPGAIVLTVRQPHDWKPIIVSHVGFIIPTDEGIPTTMRHATKMAGSKVRDHYLGWYIERLRWFKRPVEGISVLMPIDQGPRISRLETSE
jgi:hypothetical protein